MEALDWKQHRSTSFLVLIKAAPSSVSRIHFSLNWKRFSQQSFNLKINTRSTTTEFSSATTTSPIFSTKSTTVHVSERIASHHKTHNHLTGLEMIIKRNDTVHSGPTSGQRNASQFLPDVLSS